MPSNLLPLLNAVRQYLAVEYPGEVCIELRLKLAHGGKVALPVPAAAAVPPVESEPTTLQVGILELLDQAGPLKTSAIATRLGRNYTGHFRGVIKEMREAGEIELNADGKYQIAGEEGVEDE